MVEKRKIDQLKKIEDMNETLEIEHYDFVEVLKNFGRKSTKTYDFLIKLGDRPSKSEFFCAVRI